LDGSRCAAAQSTVPDLTVELERKRRKRKRKRKRKRVVLAHVSNM
jgi:hypothetical protein